MPTVNTDNRKCCDSGKDFELPEVTRPRKGYLGDKWATPHCGENSDNYDWLVTGPPALSLSLCQE